MTDKPRAVIKQNPSDFFVAENLGFSLSGKGEHLWLYVEKIGANTAWIKREWSQISGIPEREIAHSGLKDRHAVTRQWFSLPAKKVGVLNEGENWKILDRQLNSRKLRIGSHVSNDFVIILREINAKQQNIEEKLQEIAAHGFPNFFAEQRFGRENLERALYWVERGKLPRKHNERSRTLSVLRSYCFNAQIAAREKAGNLFQIEEGDKAMLAGSNSYFAIPEINAEVITRLESGDIAPAGWLGGKGEKPQQQDLAAALIGLGNIINYLSQFADSGWRALTVRPQNLSWQWLDNQTLKIAFTLPRGSYATALLGEIFMLENGEEA